MKKSSWESLSCPSTKPMPVIRLVLRGRPVMTSQRDKRFYVNSTVDKLSTLKVMRGTAVKISIKNFMASFIEVPFI